MNIIIIDGNNLFDLMIILYNDKETQKICNDENYAKRKIQPVSCINNLKTLLFRLNQLPHFDIFFTNAALKRYKAEYRKGAEKKDNIIELTIDKKYRMRLKVLDNSKDIDTILIIKVDLHYGD